MVVETITFLLEMDKLFPIEFLYQNFLASFINILKKNFFGIIIEFQFVS